MKTREHVLTVRLPIEIFKELQVVANNNCATISAIARDFILRGLANKNTNEHIFSSDTEWANAVKNRDGHKCMKCGSTKDIQAHHIRPIKNHGMHILSNGITLCGACHRVAHSSDEHLCVTEDIRT